MLLSAACTAAGAIPASEPGPAHPPRLTTTSRPPPTTVADLRPEPQTVKAVSGLGRMTWQMYPLDYLVTHADSYQGGYVALLYDSLSHRPEYRGIATPGLVATSSDGVVWTPLPLQPGNRGTFTAQVLAIDERGQLIVLGRPLSEIGAPDVFELLAYTWDGEVWTEVPVQTPDGSLTRGGELDVAYLADGSVMFVGVEGGAWYLSDSGFEYGPANTDGWPNFLARFDTIHAWPLGTGVVMPSSSLATMMEYEGRYVAVALPGRGGVAWTSTDGLNWTQIEINAPWASPNGAPAVVSPEVVDAGGLGWVAVGSWTANGAVWVSRDGVTWSHIEELPGPAGWDPRVPWPPATVVDDERILIYGRAHDAVTPATQSMVWVGTVDS
jgi:hypothetical protein